MTILQPIESQSCGCDARSGKSLISIDDALARIQLSAKPIQGVEACALKDAVGRTLCEPVRALGMVPPFANAAMDGYAINTADLSYDGPWELAVEDRVAAGQSRQAQQSRGTAIQIFTGAPVPDGANAVVMQENVQRTKSSIIIDRKVAPRAHIRAAGEDMVKGKIIVPAGRLLTARDIAACAAAGHATLPVHRRLRVALLVTGDEVCQPGQPRGTAGIWDVNTPMLRAAITSPAIAVLECHSAADTRTGLRRQLADLSDSNDLVITTGGISVGEEDHVKPALNDLNASMIFSGVAIKPGKPISFGKIGSAFWLGLPGNPLSAFVTWQLFGRALCNALTGRTQTRAARRHVVLSSALHHKPGRCEMRLARVSGFDHLGREVADGATTTHSGRVATLPDMDGLLFIPSNAETLPSGALVEFLPF
jgi:molybdopterin molybdotransferase